MSDSQVRQRQLEMASLPALMTDVSLRLAKLDVIYSQHVAHVLALQARLVAAGRCVSDDEAAAMERAEQAVLDVASERQRVAADGVAACRALRSA